jgi:hypothetical protein
MIKVEEKVQLFLQGLNQLQSSFDSLAQEIGQMMQEIKTNCERDYNQHLGRINASTEERISQYRISAAEYIQENERLRNEIDEKDRIIRNLELVSVASGRSGGGRPRSLRPLSSTTPSSLSSLINRKTPLTLADIYDNEESGEEIPVPVPTKSGLSTLLESFPPAPLSPTIITPSSPTHFSFSPPPPLSPTQPILFQPFPPLSSGQPTRRLFTAKKK